jgi:hypothetical protein
MSEFDAYNCEYTSEEEYNQDFHNNYPLTWELDHLTDVNSPDYNVDYVSPIRKARLRHQPPNAPRKMKKKKERLVRKMSTQTTLNFKSVKNKMD